MAAENPVILSKEEKARIRHHMGYLNVDPVMSIQLGVPAASQPMFLVEGAMERIPPSAIGIVRDIVAQLDSIDCKIREAPDFELASELGSLKLRDNYLGRLQEHYLHWANRLSDILGAPLNPFSARWGAAGTVPLNGRVAQT